jgi:hypothetical protein
VGLKNTPVNNEQGTAVVGSNVYCYDGQFFFWPYPSGGDPSGSLFDAPYAPQGQSVSIATK